MRISLIRLRKSIEAALAVLLSVVLAVPSASAAAAAAAAAAKAVSPAVSAAGAGVFAPLGRGISALPQASLGGFQFRPVSLSAPDIGHALGPSALALPSAASPGASPVSAPVARPAASKVRADSALRLSPVKAGLVRQAVRPAASPMAALRMLTDDSAPEDDAVRFFDQGGRGSGETDGAPAAPETEIFLIRALPGAGTGRDQGQALEALIERSEGRVKSLDQDGPSFLFQQDFAVEVRSDAREEILSELAAIGGLEYLSLPELLDLAERREARPLPDAEALAAYAARLEQGSLADRMTAFAELASALESATEDEIAALPEEAVNALLIPLYNLAGVSINAFNRIQGAARQGIRGRLHDEGFHETAGWAALEQAAQDGLRDPELRARFMPLRTMLLRMLGAMDRLGTPASRRWLTEMLPHADYAGLEFVAADASRRERYVREWLGAVSRSVEETLEGMRQGAERGEGWHGSQNSGGYTHVDGRRQSTYMYFWTPGRLDPGDMNHDLLLTLGMPGGAAVADLLSRTLEAVESRILEMDSLNRENRIGQELERVESSLAAMVESYEEAGRPLAPEQIEKFRGDLTRQVLDDYEEHHRVDGHVVVDKLLRSLSYRPWHALIPGFDETVFVSNALRFLTEAAERTTSPGLVRQLAEAAVQFLADLAAAPLLEARADLRALAVSTWEAVSAKARALDIVLTTRMDGVITPRPQILTGEPVSLEGSEGGSQVWQLAVRPDGRFIARADGDRVIKIWNARTHALVKTIELKDARQLYGDLANWVGVSWADDGFLLVTTLHDHEDGEDKYSYNLMRSFDPDGPKAELGPEDAVTTSRFRGHYVLRENSVGPGGPFYASTKNLRNDQGHYLGAEVHLIRGDGDSYALIENAVVKDLRGQTLLTAAPGRSQSELRLWDVSDPSEPADRTPEWLTERIAAWRERNPPSEYGWRPDISAKLGVVAGRPALLIHDEGRLEALDLETGETLSSLEVPNGWNVPRYLTDDDGRTLAAVVSAPGEFSGPNPERLMVWDLASGEIVMERDATYVPQGMIYARGRAVQELLFSPDGRRLFAATRTGVQAFALP